MERLAPRGAALKHMAAIDKRETGRWLQNWPGIRFADLRFLSAVPTTGTGMPTVRHMQSPQTFVAVHGSIHNHCNQKRPLASRAIFKDCRAAALAAWRQPCAASSMPGQGALGDFLGLSDSAIGDIPFAEAGDRYDAMLDQPAMAA